MFDLDPLLLCLINQLNPNYTMSETCSKCHKGLLKPTRYEKMFICDNCGRTVSELTLQDIQDGKYKSNYSN